MREPGANQHGCAWDITHRRAKLHIPLFSQESCQGFSPLVSFPYTTGRLHIANGRGRLRAGSSDYPDELGRAHS